MLDLDSLEAKLLAADDEPAVHDKEYWDDWEHGLDDDGKHEKVWKANTAYRVATAWNNWVKFTQIRRLLHPEKELSMATTKRFKAYVTWLAKRAREGCGIATFRNQWMYLQMHYQQRFGVPISKDIRDNVGKYLGDGGDLVQEFNLRIGGIHKPVLARADYVELLTTLWACDSLTFAASSNFTGNRRRAQLWFYEHMAGYTAARTGALVQGFNFGAKEAPLPRYRDCELFYFAAPGLPPVVMLIVSFLRRKGRANIRKPIKFVFHPNPCLLLCPVMSFLTMAFADQAFANKGLREPGDMLLAKIPRASHIRRWDIKFKREVLDLPLFRGDNNEPLKARAIQSQLARLGKATGFQEIVSTYCIRRGAANAISGLATESEQNHILGHRVSTVFDSWYRDQAVTFDVMSAYCGVPSRSERLQAATGMLAKRDPRYPHKLTAGMKAQVELDPAVIKARNNDKTLKDECKCEHTTLSAAAENPRIAELLKRTKTQLETARRRASGLVLKSYQARFCDSQPVNDLDAILEGKPVDGIEHDDRKQVYYHEERRRIVEAFQIEAFPDIASDGDLRMRATVLKDLVRLCELDDPHHSSVWQRDIGIGIDANSRQEQRDEDGRAVLTDRTCIFCFFNTSFGDSAALRSCYARANKMREHVSHRHKELLQQLETAPRCPDPVCLLTVFEDRSALYRHFDDVHRAPIDRDARSSHHRPFSGADKDGRTRVGDLTCIFCHFDATHGITSRRAAPFLQVSHLKRHVMVHLNSLEFEPKRCCPDPACRDRDFSSIHDFIRHADLVHWVALGDKGRYRVEGRQEVAAKESDQRPADFNCSPQADDRELNWDDWILGGLEQDDGMDDWILRGLEQDDETCLAGEVL